jgi:hypothetical protein
MQLHKKFHKELWEVLEDKIPLNCIFPRYKQAKYGWGLDLPNYKWYLSPFPIRKNLMVRYSGGINFRKVNE